MIHRVPMLVVAVGLLSALQIAGLPPAAHAEGALFGAPLITQALDESQLVTLVGNTHPAAVTPGNDRGAVADDMALPHMHLQLQRSPEQERAVQNYVDALQTPGSPVFHQWLTAEQLGDRFGTAPADVDAVTHWLEHHGFQVNFVYPNRMVIDFSGSAGQVKAAFHTDIHRLEVKGVAHFANIGDPSIPAALAPVVAGIVSLHDFRARNRHRPAPHYTGGDCGGVPCTMMAPADLATIYNFNPLFKASSPITGQGQTIALAEDTNLYSNSDWSNFRSIFGLTAYSSGNLQIVHPAPKSGGTNCSNPGVNSDDVEATLDVEWASAAAPNATIMLTSCDSVGSTDGVYLSIQNLVNGKTAPPPIVSVSYGICETENGAAGNKAFYTLYQTAVAQGVSVFVATGDNGPLDCSDGSENNMGIGVNGWASTPYNVAVGGTDFSDTYSGTNGTYWGKSTGKPWGTAKSYIPETPWNDTCASTLLATSYGYSVSYGKSGFCNSSDGSDYLQLGGGEGGPSACATGSSSSSSGVVNGTCKGYPKPNWQAGVYGIPADGVRDLPDVSLFAADGTWNHQYLICYTDRHNGGTVNCSGDPNNWGAGGGGTSYATPIIAGIQALVNEKMGGKAQGNPNPVYYKLAAKEYGASGNASCNSNKGKSILSTCIFNDVTLGDDMQNCRGTHNCFLDGGTNGVLSVLSSSYKPAFMAKIGFDFPSGIGTINAKNLVNSWAGATK